MGSARRISPLLLCLASLGCGGEEFADAPNGSCASLRDNGTKASGVYEIDPGGASGPVETYCEMDLDGGGWALVARSANQGPDGNGFGWKRQSGKASDTSVPFSLDVEAAGLSFTEILVVERDAGYGAVKAFKASVPAGFLADYDQTPHEFQPPFEAVAGPCAPPGGVWMLTYGGHTGETDFFFFRDHVPMEAFGLFADGWGMAQGSECQYNAGLTGRHGMIFVR